jgi:putative holliday junction resolvase
MARILGVDCGERRTGLAISDETGLLATPLRVIEGHTSAEHVRAVVAAFRETAACLAVVGLPRNMNGSEGPKAREALAFCDALRREGVAVETWDERLTTALVERALLEGDVSRKRRKQVRDKLAAQVILQGYLDAQVAAAPDAGEDGACNATA